MVDRKEYMRLYRAKNRERLTEYHRQYLADPENRERQRAACRRYYRDTMSAEQKAKKKAYLKEYYQKHKKENNHGN